MRPVRIIAATAVVVALAVTGCSSRSADQTAAPASAAPSPVPTTQPTTRPSDGSVQTTTTTLATPANASCALSPARGPAETRVTLSCHGFAPSEPVKVTFGATVLATATATAGGQMAASFAVPSGFAGSHYPGRRHLPGQGPPERHGRVSHLHRDRLTSRHPEAPQALSRAEDHAESGTSLPELAPTDIQRNPSDQPFDAVGALGFGRGAGLSEAGVPGWAAASRAHRLDTSHAGRGLVCRGTQDCGWSLELVLIPWVGGDLAQPWPRTAHRSAAGTMRTAARRRPSQPPRGRSQRRALPARRRRQDLEPDPA